jgi:RNA recognition motif-containing protein
MNIFVANLSFDVNDFDLKDLFAEYGEVSSARVISDKFTGKSKGYGFVEMPVQAEAEKAVAELNQCEFDGKEIAVTEARPREDRPAGGNRGGYNGGSRGGYNGGSNAGGNGGERRGGGSRY